MKSCSVWAQSTRTLNQNGSRKLSFLCFIHQDAYKSGSEQLWNVLGVCLNKVNVLGVCLNKVSRASLIEPSGGVSLALVLPLWFYFDFAMFWHQLTVAVHVGRDRLWISFNFVLLKLYVKIRLLLPRKHRWPPSTKTLGEHQIIAKLRPVEVPRL